LNGTTNYHENKSNDSSNTEKRAGSVFEVGVEFLVEIGVEVVVVEVEVVGVGVVVVVV
jgi:hypothetical protein